MLRKMITVASERAVTPRYHHVCIQNNRYVEQEVAERAASDSCDESGGVCAEPVKFLCGSQSDAAYRACYRADHFENKRNCLFHFYSKIKARYWERTAPLLSLYFFRAMLLQEAEHYHLRHNHTHEHRERIDRGVSHGGSVVVGNLVGVGECRGIGVAATHHTEYG